MEEIQKLAVSFSHLIAEALDMDPNSFDKFFDTPQHNKLKLVKYPAPPPETEIPKGGVQGVGARRCSLFLSSFHVFVPKSNVLDFLKHMSQSLLTP